MVLMTNFVKIPGNCSFPYLQIPSLDNPWYFSVLIKSGFHQKPFASEVLLLPVCHNLKVRRFSQGFPCETPLRTHSLQTSNAPHLSPINHKPMNHSYFQNAPFDKMKTRHRFSPFGGSRESFID
jgi:hypothetical protein